MIDERERNRLERWGVIEPEPIMPPDTNRLHPDEFPPLPQAEIPSLLDAVRVPTTHEPPRPRCPRCHRPYNPDARLQRGIENGCYSCAPLDRASLTAELERRRQLDMAALIETDAERTAIAERLREIYPKGETCDYRTRYPE